MSKLEEVLDGSLDEVINENNEVENDDILEKSYLSDGWQNYVLNQFHDHEKENNSPNCMGLYRVVNDLIGPVSSRRVLSNACPSSENRFTATVTVEVEIVVTNETHPLVGRVVTFSEIADCGSYNTDHPYHLHQSATASTRAEARIYRKVLGLSGVLAAEEVVNNPVEDLEEWEAPTPIADAQINVIGLLCKRLNISVEDFVNSGEHKYQSIYEIKSKTAGKIINRLNQIQRGVGVENLSFKEFDDSWESSFRK